MPRIVIVILIYHRHKPIDLISLMFHRNVCFYLQGQRISQAGSHQEANSFPCYWAYSSALIIEAVCSFETLVNYVTQNAHVLSVVTAVRTPNLRSVPVRHYILVY
jgi:hypothetical protein